MKILNVCTNYFSGFQDIVHCCQNDAKTNALAMLKIVSYFSLVIPLCFAALFTAASLCGRVSKIESISLQDQNIINEAGKTITKKIEPKLPQEIREAAKKAAGGEQRHTAGGWYHEELLEMVNDASTEEISYIIEGVLSHENSMGLKRVLGELLRLTNLGGADDIKKLKLAIKTIPEERLFELVDKSKLPSIAGQFRNRIDFDFYNDLGLKLLQKYAQKLSLSDGFIKQIGEYIEHLENLCEITKHLPREMLE